LGGVSVESGSIERLKKTIQHVVLQEEGGEPVKPEAHRVSGEKNSEIKQRSGQHQKVLKRKPREIPARHCKEKREICGEERGNAQAPKFSLVGTRPLIITRKPETNHSRRKQIGLKKTEKHLPNAISRVPASRE